MICNKCGEQIPDGSAFCLRCGVPVEGEAESAPENTTIIEPTSEDSEGKNTKSTLPIIIVTALIIFSAIFIAVSANRKNQGLDINAESVAINELYNPSLGVGLRLGMTKTVVDQKLGEPQLAFGEYLYKDTYLYATYSGGKLASMLISWPNERWITKNGVTIGITADELQQLLGQPSSIQHDDKWWYYIYGNKVTGFEVVHDSVVSIYIYDRTLVTE